MRFEEEEKVKIESLNSLEAFKSHSDNNLYYLNRALSLGGYNLEVHKNYKCKKPIVIYNYFTSNLDNKIINSSNKINLNQNSELTLIEYNIDNKSKFFKNTFEKLRLIMAQYLNVSIYKNKSNAYFYKNISGHKIIIPATKILY